MAPITVQALLDHSAHLGVGLLPNPRPSVCSDAGSGLSALQLTDSPMTCFCKPAASAVS